MDAVNRANQFFATSLTNEEHIEIWDSLDDEDVDDGLLGCDAVWMKMESIRSYETLLSTYKFTRRHNSEDYDTVL
jgi:hypothetical protein